MKHFFAHILLLLFTVNLFAQETEKGNSITYLNIDYGLHFPAADLADRFGMHSIISGQLFHKSKKNWIFGFEQSFITGNRLKNIDFLDGMRNEDGNITDTNGNIAELTLLMRGFKVETKIGKLFNNKKNKNTGMLLLFGAGYLQHKMVIDDVNKTVRWISFDDFRKGYDRMSAGFHMSQFIGYQYFGEYQLLNFKVGIEIIEAFTKSQRSYYLGTDELPEGNRFDLSTGFHISWIIPFYKTEKDETERYYYN